MWRYTSKEIILFTHKTPLLTLYTVQGLLLHIPAYTNAQIAVMK